MEYKKNKADFIYNILTRDVSNEYIVKGMMFWYFLNGRVIANIQDDMHFRSIFFNREEDIRIVIKKVRTACEAFTREEN